MSVAVMAIVAAMNMAAMASEIDFHGLQPVAFAHGEADVGFVLGDMGGGDIGHRRQVFLTAHTDPAAAVTLRRRTLRNRGPI